MNADTTVHLAHVQAFFYKLESLAGENIILLYLFGKKKKNNKITSRCLSNFKGPIVSYFSAALSCEQRPFLSSGPAFIRNIVVLRDREE